MSDAKETVAELLFPLAAVGLTFLVAVPLLTVFCRAVLRARRARETVWSRFGSPGTFALLVAPGLIPSLWLASSAVHQSEPSRSLKNCLLDHVDSETCADALLLTVALLFGLTFVLLSRANTERPRLALETLPSAHPEAERVRRIVQNHSALRGLDVRLLRRSPEPVFTTGWFRARCHLDACFVAAADDEMILAALLHERAHAWDFDNLRCFLVRVTLALNPARRLLTRDLLLWQAAREAACDGWAVHRGGQPLALAEVIVRAAKFHCTGQKGCGSPSLPPRGVSALCGHDTSTLKLRVSLLFEGPAHLKDARGHLLLASAVILAVIMPHIEPLAYLDQFHLAVERLIRPVP